MIERVRRAVEGPGAPVRVYREGVDLVTLAERARRSHSFLDVPGALRDDDTTYTIRSEGTGRVGLAP